jgi:hypothetical protein
MIPSNSRLPLVGDRGSDPAPQVKTKPKIKTFLRGERQQSLPPSGASRWSALRCPNSSGKETQRPIDPSPRYRLILQ